MKSSMALFPLFFIQLLLVPLAIPMVNAQGLRLGFYAKTCPSAEAIVSRVTASFVSRAPTLAASLLRLHFHDCFVRGCDGSVLINSTPKNQAEKSAIPNLSLRGFQVIDAVKSALEKQCPGVVSCADIVALVARYAVQQIHGPSWPVPLGRRDGRVSIASEALTNIPAPFFNITQLKASFSSKGLSTRDLAVLSGAHTIGVSHCSTISSRLYNFTGKGNSDPTMDSRYVKALKRKCKPSDTTTLIEMDPGSSRIFDNKYYRDVAGSRGLFVSDWALLTDSTTNSYVQLQQSPRRSTFLKDFGTSMVKMGQIGILTGTKGEIRKICTAIN